ncbi:hypothetical protein Shyhy01_53960 [Streptomyces hygroscopicus subsp. hygroscopicus]|nr:hypothetical protein Shyhy01_53960 [Streptomyces hygroscopicus subsp. hygroscopicus]
MHRKRLVTGVRVSVVLIAVVLSSASCGGSGTSPSGKGQSSHVATPDLAAPLHVLQLKRVLDLQSMPTGWKTGVQTLAGRDVPKDSPCRRPSHVCAGMTSHAIVQYDNEDSTGNVYFELSAYEDREAALAGYKSRSASFVGKDNREISMPTVGNASTACTGSNKWTGDPFTGVVMRVGTVVASVTYTHKNKADPQMLLSLARMQVERIQQAQRGETPTARLEDHGS